MDREIKIDTRWKGSTNLMLILWNRSYNPYAYVGDGQRLSHVRIFYYLNRPARAERRGGLGRQDPKYA